MNNKIRLTGTIVLVVLCGNAASQETPEVEQVADLIARASTCIYYPHFDAYSPSDIFTEKELDVLSRYREAVNLMITDALGRGHSICGAYFAQRFDLKQNLDAIRYHILEPGRFYAWGAGRFDRNDELRRLDESFVYDSKYIHVAESLSGVPIHEFIELTEQEYATILSLSADEDHESHEWALWMSRKLKLC